MSVGEREARSVALEKAYVHQVYEQISSSQYLDNKSRSWPRIKQFLEDLEPGSLVCDVGCGKGKYLSVNPNIYKLGADRCFKLTEVAREKENEVLVCDNLALPFRDECFDAVISVAVVHHFATTERRVGALRELARVLRIGGRLVISVWAMEQRHRKFESQDVLVPWHRPQHLSTPSLELTSTTTNTSEEDCPPPYHAYTQTSDSDSCRSVRAAGSGQRKRGRSRHKGRSIDPSKPLTSSPSSSSLSSPNETCYSFVRKALQKLAGGKRGGSRHRPWFLESWTSCTKEPSTHRYDPEGCEDIHNLPIELRRLEEEQDAPQRRQTFACSHQLTDVPLNHNKSKSLSDIIAVEQKAIVRSRSSVPSLEVSPPEETSTEATPSSSSGNKPKLVKQKKSVCEEDFEGEERDEPTDMKDLIKALPEFKVSGFGYGGTKRGNVFKQSSMNEELMSTERLREKERVRQNIQKQASLNEDLMFRRNKTLDSLRDTLFSASTAKRFQLLKNGFTNKIKNSTTGIEKVAGASFKNGFVRILQGWTGTDVGSPIPQPAPPPIPSDSTKLVVDEKKETERRHSREDGSDSSKDSSLQSDTSVDSEDSFASVIFVPKPEPPPEQTSTNTSPTPASPQPTSPKFKLPPPTSQAPIPFGIASHPSSPKLKHLGSSTPSSPKIKYFSQPTSPRPFQTSFLTSPTTKTAFKLQISPNESQIFKAFPFPKPITQPSSYTPQNIGHITPTSPTAGQASIDEVSPILSPTEPKSNLRTPSPKNSKGNSAKSLSSPKEDTKPAAVLDLWPKLSPGVSPTSPSKDPIKHIVSSIEPDKHAERLKQIQELLRQRPGNNPKSSQFPLVRRSTTLTPSQQSSSRTLPRLMSLELFNPETDDMDSDSSGVSSPDSVGSVISVLNEDDHGVQVETIAEQKGEENIEVELKIESLPAASSHEKIRVEFEEVQSEPVKISKSPRVSPSHSLLEAAADVASTLEETVDAVIQCSPRAKRKQLKLFEGTDPLSVLQDDILTRKSPHRTEDFRHSTSKMSVSPSCTDESVESPKTQDRWSLQVNNSVSFTALDVNKSSSLGAIPKKNNRSYRHLAHLENVKKHKAYSNTENEQAQAVKEESWDEECRQHLADFAEKLSEKLLAEIDRYRVQSTFPNSVIVANLPPDIQDINDPYLNRLSEELQDLTKLSLELHERHNSFVKKLKQTSVPNDTSSNQQIKQTSTLSNEMFATQQLKPSELSSDMSNAQEIKQTRDTHGDLKQTNGLNDIIAEKQIQQKNGPSSESSAAQELKQTIKLNSEILTAQQLKQMSVLSSDVSTAQQSKQTSEQISDVLVAQQLKQTSGQNCDILTAQQLKQTIGLSSDVLPVQQLKETRGLSSDLLTAQQLKQTCRLNSDTITVQQNVLHETVKSDNCSFLNSSSSDKGLVKCNQEEVEDIKVQPSIVLDNRPSSIGFDELEDMKSSKAVNCDCSVRTEEPSVTINNNSVQNVDQKSDIRIELSDVESPVGSDSSWADSRRNTILPAGRGDSLRTDEYVGCEDFTSRIEILPGSEMPRRPSISIETSDPMERIRSENFEPGISLESSEAGDISERTGSSSDGSRSGSRRDTIQICDSGSVLSLRPGLSLESSDAGSGSEGSRAGDSRRNTISIGGDHTSGSQASLLRPGISLESSDCGDVSERTASSDSRRDTSSAGKTASTASLASDRVGSDCSKDARYADRRLARCDGRSSSEETAPVHRGCMNKLVRQRASTQEPPENLTKTESCETSLSGSTSQESLLSDSGGGAITFHRYYHVFKEGELDQLIERYVENLHIISSYYDHANWCVIAEKVQVWTI